MSQLMQSIVFLLSLSTIVTAHPLDELGKDPYLADAPRALDIAIALEKNGNIELGFFMQLDKLMTSKFSPTEVKESYAQGDNATLTKPLLSFAKAHISQLVELYSDGERLSGSLSFRELNQELQLPKDGRVWCRFRCHIQNPMRPSCL